MAVAAETMTRTGPEPSSRSKATPVVNSVGPSTIVPWIRTRRPSSASAAPPVVVGSGAGSEAAPTMASWPPSTRRVRCEKRSSTSPVASTTSPRANAPSVTSSAMPPVPSSTYPPPSVNEESVRAVARIVAVAPSGSARTSETEAGADGPGEDVGTGVEVATGVGLGTADGVDPAVGLALGSAVGVGASVAIGVGVADGSGAGGDVLFWGCGGDSWRKSAALSFVSWPDPAPPPGRRSTDAPAGGAGTGAPSSQVDAALPHPNASIALDAPWMRSARLPPVAAMPLGYSTSAMPAKAPASLAI